MFNCDRSLIVRYQKAPGLGAEKKHTDAEQSRCLLMIVVLPSILTETLSRKEQVTLVVSVQSRTQVPLTFDNWPRMNAAYCNIRSIWLP